MMNMLLGALVILLAGGWLWSGIRRRRKLATLTELARRAATATGSVRVDESPPVVNDEFFSLRRELLRARDQLTESFKQAEDERRKLVDVLEGMADGVLVVDESGGILIANRRANELLGMPPGRSCAGTPLIEITRHPDLHGLLRRVAASDRESSGPSLHELTLGGVPDRTVRVTVSPLRPASGERRAFIFVFHDITDLKNVEEMRRDFVANVSHELRTPLAAIRGYSETLLESTLRDAEETRRFVTIIERHSRRLGRLVDDLLTLSDLELGRTELRCVPVDPRSTVRAVLEVVRPAADERGVAMRAEVDPKIGEINADPDRLEQALLNLVDNAVKYTSGGGSVRVAARLPADEVAESAGLPGPGFVELAVADTGPGIPREALPRVTERFYRVDKARSRELGGTGLGLAIVKHIVHLHGGVLRIDSEVGKGTTARMYLPGG